MKKKTKLNKIIAHMLSLFTDENILSGWLEGVKETDYNDIYEDINIDEIIEKLQKIIDKLDK